MWPDLSIALRFIRALTGADDVRLRLIHDQERGRTAIELTGDLTRLWPRIEQEQENGYAVFYYLNNVREGAGSGYAGSCTDGDVTGIRVIAADCDDGLPEPWEWHTPPGFIVHTSRAKGQLLWPARLPVGEFKQAQRRLIAFYGSDRAVTNASRIFRLPGSLHQKKEPQLVTFEEVAAWLPGVDPLAGLPELPAVEPPGLAVGAPVTLDHLRTILGFVRPDDRTGWRDLVAAIRNTPAGSEEERLAILKEKVAPEWHEETERIWETMPPRVGGVAYGSIFFAARAGGYKGLSAASVPAAERFKAPSLWTPFSASVVARVPALEELVPGLIEKGITTFLSGVGGVNKSRLAVQWGLCIDAGLPIWGIHTQKATFVYLSYEDHRNEVTRRIQQITKKLHITVGTGQWADLRESPSPLATVGDDVMPEPFYEELGAYLKAIPGHKFVVYDSTYDILRFVGNAKVNETSVHDAINFLDRFAAECDSTQLCLWHPSQAGSEREGADGWSVAWHNAPRARLALEADKDNPDAYRLRVVKRNNAPKPKEPISLHWAEGTLAPWTAAVDKETQSRFFEAVIQLATEAAISEQPFKQLGRLPTWFYKKIELMTGRRPTQREVKEALEEAQQQKKLRYGAGPKSKDPRGYYPWSSPSHETT